MRLIRDGSNRAAVCAAAVAVVVCAGASSAPEARAWAWTNDCASMAENASPGVIRLLSWTPVPPGPDIVKVAGYIKDGLGPGEIGMRLNHTGIPATWGCSGTVTYQGPDLPVACAYAAPTTGSNKFTCTGNSQQRWLWSSDDLTVSVGVPKLLPKGPGSSEGGVTQVPAPPDATEQQLLDVVTDTPAGGPARGALRRSDLGTPEGWGPTDDVASLGPVGRALSAGDPSKRCAQVADRLEPVRYGTSLLAGEDGREFAGSTVVQYRSAREADGVYDDVMSARSMRCLASILESGDAGGDQVTTVQVTAGRLAKLPAETDAFELLVAGRDGAGPWTQAVEVIGLRDGDTFHVLLAVGESTADRLDDRPVLRTLLRRM